MSGDALLLLRGNEIAALLAGREAEIIATVRDAYVLHGRGASSLPHSSFLRFPGQPRNRIIALPAFIGGRFDVAGIKWVASFPGNHELRLERASAAIILSSAQTGRPLAILEGSVISARRTAASAALAALHLADPGTDSVGLVGCGYIQHEIMRFLLATFPRLRRVVLYDNLPDKARLFAAQVARLSPALEFEEADSVEALLARTRLTSFATTALAPYLADLSMCPPGSTLLHVSLRDLTAAAILASDNLLDDIDHVCREQTSVHLAEQQVGQRGFIRGTLAQVLEGAIPARTEPPGVAVFSPFGLGILDLALAQLACRLASESGAGMAVESFSPDSWLYTAPENPAR